MGVILFFSEKIIPCDDKIMLNYIIISAIALGKSAIDAAAYGIRTLYASAVMGLFPPRIQPLVIEQGIDLHWKILG